MRLSETRMTVLVKFWISFIIANALFISSGRAENADIPRRAPELANQTWINSAPLRLAGLRGKVVLVEFWTYGCSNCRNVEPYVKQWHGKYAPQGLVVIGVHAPEFAAESDVDNVKRYVAQRGIRHAVAIDNDFATWRRYNNRYWPTMYLIDKQGMIREIFIGEGDYARREKRIQALLAEGRT